MAKSVMPETPCYEVRVADNFRYMDKDAEYSAGFSLSDEEAIEKCKLIVECSLQECRKGGKNVADILACYRHFGDDPYVLAHNGAPSLIFSAWNYADGRATTFAQESSAGP